MIFQFAKKLNAQQTIQGHEKQEEQRYVVNLLTRTPVENNLDD